MRKLFTFKLSDEPYKSETKLNKTVEAYYTGPRYIALCVNDQDGRIMYMARNGENTDQLDFNLLVDDDPATSFVILDANEHTFVAAYLTGLYEHDPIPDYEETLSGDRGSWTYSYSGGGISQNYYSFDIFYRNGEYTQPRFREHAVERESLISSSKNTAALIKTSLDENDYTEADRKKLQDYALWLENLEETYHDVDHWKIPFPAGIPQY